MNFFGAFTVLLLAGLASTAPLSDEVLSVTSEFFPKELAIYTSEYDIVNLLCPLNSLNFDEDAGVETLDGANITVFFIEADVKEKSIDYKGLYVLRNKVATKILDNGRDFAATSDDSREVFLAATDGIYVYSPAVDKAVKYGNITDSLIGIAAPLDTNYFVYILTEDHVLYKVTHEGTVKEEVSDVKDATQIVMDFESNLFFLDTKKHLYVRTVDGVINKVKGVPANPSFAKLLRPPFVLQEGVPFIGNKKVFGVYPNGTSEYENMFLKDRPSAYAIEGTLIQYYAYNKTIYEYNLLAIMLGAIEMDELKTYFADKTDEIQKMGSQTKKALRAPK